MKRIDLNADDILLISIFGGVSAMAVIGLMRRHTMGWSDKADRDAQHKLLKKRYGEITMSPQEEDEYDKLYPAAMKGDKHAKARISQLHNLETARSLKSIQRTTGSYPTPAKIPPELKQYYKHTMPDKVEDIVNKANAGHPLTHDEETQLHSIEARGHVSGCGPGCICGVDGHCDGSCPTHGYECDYSKDRHTYAEPVTPHTTQSPIEGAINWLAKGAGNAWNHLIHGQNISGQPMFGTIGQTAPQGVTSMPQLQTPIPLGGWYYEMTYNDPRTCKGLGALRCMGRSLSMSMSQNEFTIPRLVGIGIVAVLGGIAFSKLHKSKWGKALKLR